MNPTNLVTAPAKTISTPAIDWSRGWRHEIVRNAHGQPETIRIPLTPEEARHPQEGYVMPERTEHDFTSDDLCDMLRAHFAEMPEMAVFRNLIFNWGHATIRNYAPDIAVVPRVRDRSANRGEFDVVDEGTLPILAIEIVSKNSRSDDRILKVRDYATLGIQEYVYIDIRTKRGKIVGEIAGFRLQGREYISILPDEDDALYLESVDLRIGLEGDTVWLEDPETGENLLNNLRAQQALRAEKKARLASEQALQRRIAELEAQVQALTRKA